MKKSRFTIPIEEGSEEIAKELIEKWGADALRNSDGTKMTDYFENLGLKVYATYFPTRNDQKWASENREQLQQIYLISNRVVAKSDTTKINLLESYFKEQFEVVENENYKKYWQVIDRSTGEIVTESDWFYDKENKSVIVKNTKQWRIYTAGFLARQIWDVTQMYNHITNDWGDKTHEAPYDPAFPETRKHILEDLENWLKNNPKVNVIRFTTFFYHFTVIYDNLKRQKFGDWFGYSASVSSKDIDDFNKTHDTCLKAEDIIDQGYYNTAYRTPSKNFLEYMEYKQKFVSKLAKECVDLVHKYGKEAMMFIGDNWIGTEPFGDSFKNIGLDAIVGSASSGAGIRMISDIPGVKYREVRFLPYFFPDTFNDEGDPVSEASNIWIKSRRALAVKLLDRMGYGGYLSLAYKYKSFVDTVTKITDQFNELHNVLNKTQMDYFPITIGVLNAWGKIKTWQSNTTGHIGGIKEGSPFTGVFEALSGMPFEIKFINFNDIKNGALKYINVLINLGSANTAWSGGKYWKDVEVVTKIREWVYDNGGGFLGVGEPTAYPFEGAFFQLSDIIGVDKEIENTINFSKYDKLYEGSHFITEGLKVSNIDTGFSPRNIYGVSEKLKILSYDKIDGIKVAVNKAQNGRGCYISGLPFSNVNGRLLYRTILWLSKREEEVKELYCNDTDIDVYTYGNKKLLLALNNSLKNKRSMAFVKEKMIELDMEPMGMKFYDL